MNYKITAYKSQVGAQIEIEGGAIVAGIIPPSPLAPDKDFFIICLEPIWPKVTTGGEGEEGEEGEEGKEGEK